MARFKKDSNVVILGTDGVPVYGTTKTYERAFITVGSGGALATDIVAATASKQVFVVAASIDCDGNNTFTWKTGTTDALSGAKDLAAATPLVYPHANVPEAAWFATVAGKALMGVVATTAVNTNVEVVYYKE